MQRPHLTVAVLCEKEEGRILMVNEIDNGINCWNQPAGHVEPGESLEQAAEREALEETGYRVRLTGIQGLYQGIHSETGTHFLRVCFTADALDRVTEELDDDIIQARWLPKTDLLAGKYRLRSQIALSTLEDHANAPIYPLALIHRFSPGVE